MPGGNSPSGVRFPIEVAGHGLARVEGEDVVRQSILLILRTARGERVMRPDFGCGLRELVFAPLDATTAGRAVAEVREALERWEPRIEVLEVRSSPEPAPQPALLIHLVYRILSTGEVGSLVYPLSLE
jgi:uncharacterized protein